MTDRANTARTRQPTSRNPTNATVVSDATLEARLANMERLLEVRQQVLAYPRWVWPWIQGALTLAAFALAVWLAATRPSDASTVANQASEALQTARDAMEEAEEAKDLARTLFNDAVRREPSWWMVFATIGVMGVMSVM